MGVSPSHWEIPDDGKVEMGNSPSLLGTGDWLELQAVFVFFRFPGKLSMCIMQLVTCTEKYSTC